MITPTDLRFFEALRAFSDVDDTLRAAIDRALETGDPLDLMAARKALDDLDSPVKDLLLRQAHLHMATDLSAIWDAMPGAPGSGRAN